MTDPLGLRASGLMGSTTVHLSRSADPLGLATAGLSGGGQVRDAAAGRRSREESPDIWPSDAQTAPSRLTLPTAVQDTVGAYNWNLFE